jgi:hypothetical protein
MLYSAFDKDDTCQAAKLRAALHDSLGRICGLAGRSPSARDPVIWPNLRRLAEEYARCGRLPPQSPEAFLLDLEAGLRNTGPGDLANAGAAYLDRILDTGTAETGQTDQPGMALSASILIDDLPLLRLMVFEMRRAFLMQDRCEDLAAARRIFAGFLQALDQPIPAIEADFIEDKPEAGRAFDL